MKPGRHFVIDDVARVLRRPRQGPMLDIDDVISAALSMFVPGPAGLISPKGLGVRMIRFALRRSGYKIVAMDKEDLDREEARYGSPHQ